MPAEPYTIRSTCNPITTGCIIEIFSGGNWVKQSGYYRVPCTDTVYVVNFNGEVTSITSCAKDYYVSSQITGDSSETATFRSRDGGCSTGFLVVPSGCQIDISYSYTDITETSGFGNATITAGNSIGSHTPTGYQLTSLSIDTVSWNGGSCGSNTLTAC